MHLWTIILFWLCFACVVYTYAVYPLMVAVLNKVHSRPVRRGAPAASVSIVVCAYNEARSIRSRVRELLGALDRSGLDGELIVVSDGSTDGTTEMAQEESSLYAGRCFCRVVALPRNVGKAVALNAGCAAATKNILVFADARQTWASDALERLLENFCDPQVGAVSGDLVAESADGVMQGVGLYWRFEKRLRRSESALWSGVGVSGSIAAVRRELFQDIPRGTILDDMYWPMCVAMGGLRVIHDERAVAYDRLPDHARDEFRRKSRTLSGNYQLLALLPGTLLPWRNPVWVQLVSHKLLRLVVPWALLSMLLVSAVAGTQRFHLFFGLQGAFYALGAAGIWTTAGARWRLASAAGSFLVLNAAAWIAFWVWASGNAGNSWTKTSYQSVPTSGVGQLSPAGASQ